MSRGSPARYAERLLDSPFFHVAILLFEGLGLIALVAGFALAFGLAVRALARKEGGAAAS